MKLYKLVNNISGWVIFTIALIVYSLTAESTASFWDCGEFISGAYKLEVVHPPGAPFFLLLGRIFTMFAPDPDTVAFMVNFMSGLSSALGVLFLFWITTALAKKIVIKKGEEPVLEQILAVMGVGVIAGLACTFSDTFWFSAVEGEVYALSTMFITLVVWLMMKWENSEDERYRDKWLVLIAFVLGLSLGVHLMGLLAIPAMSLIYYFKKYTPTWKGTLIALVVGFVILLFAYIGLVNIMINIIAGFDLFFVNSIGLPFGSGITIFIVLVIAAIIGGIIYSIRKNYPNVHTALMSLVMVLLGFSLYAMVVIRALAVPPIDMNKPADIFRLQSYLNREQYGDRPLLYGPHYNAYPTEIIKKGKKYYKGEEKYEVIGERVEYKFDDDVMMLFPRLGSWQDDRHVRAYRSMLGLSKDEDPSFGDNMKFFVNYQVMFMWFRYFMWNFAGRQNDVQGRYDNNDGHWLSGITFLDEMRLGPMDNLTEEMRENKARNKFYLIPFILGVIGFFFHYNRSLNDALVVITLFAFTGLLEVVFFNSPPFEPRERDYTLVGSFITFTIWIGFGMLALYEFLRKKMPSFISLGLAFLLCLTAPFLMAKDGWDDHDRSGRYTARDFAINYLESCAPNAVIFTQGDNDTYPLWYAQEVEGIRTDVRVVNLSLLGVDWYIEQLQYKLNDAPAVKLIHNIDQQGKKTKSPEKYIGNNRDVTRYYDNKKIPQDRAIELEKVINWIASDKRETQVQVSNGEFINYMPTKNLKISVDSAAIVKNNVVPPELYGDIVKEMTFKISQNNLLKNDLMVLDIIASNLWDRPLYFAVSVSPSSYMGLQKYFQLEGLAYRIVPVEKQKQGGQQGYVAEDIMYDNVLNKFEYGGIELKDTVTYKVQSGETFADVAEKFNQTDYELKMNNPSVQELEAGQTIKILIPNDLYLDENILRMTMNLRSNFARLAEALLDAGDKDKAKKVLDKCLQVMPRETVPYNIFMVRFPELYYRIGDNERARDIARELVDVYEQELKYYVDVADFDPSSKRNTQQAFAVIQELLRLSKNYKDKQLEEELTNTVSRLQQTYLKANPS